MIEVESGIPVWRYHRDRRVLSGTGFILTVFLSQTSDDTVRDLLQRGGEILSTPAGAVGALVVIAFMLYGVFTERGWAWLMAALLFAATLADGSTEYFNNTLFSPLQQLRSSSKLVNGMLRLKTFWWQEAEPASIISRELLNVGPPMQV